MMYFGQQREEIRSKAFGLRSSMYCSHITCDDDTLQVEIENVTKRTNVHVLTLKVLFYNLLRNIHILISFNTIKLYHYFYIINRQVI
jgi:hypothetical protein